MCIEFLWNTAGPEIRIFHCGQSLSLPLPSPSLVPLFPIFPFPFPPYPLPRGSQPISAARRSGERFDFYYLYFCLYLKKLKNHYGKSPCSLWSKSVCIITVNIDRTVKLFQGLEHCTVVKFFLFFFCHSTY